MKKLILISGPSCVGKGPLLAALQRFYCQFNDIPEIPVIRSWNSRPDGQPRDEKEKKLWFNEEYFLPEDKFAKLDRARYFVGKCRDTSQAVDLEKITKSDGERLILEIYYELGTSLASHPFLENEIDVKTVFISPVSLDELNLLRHNNIDTDEYIRNLMINKQILRDIFKHKGLTQESIKSFISRAKRTPDEVNFLMSSYDKVIVCRDGEGHSNWKQAPDGEFEGTPPTGNAGRALEELASFLS